MPWNTSSEVSSLLVLCLLCTSTIAYPSNLTSTNDTACKLTPITDDFEIIRDEYIVLFHDNHTMDLHMSFLGMDANATNCTFEPYEMLNGYFGSYNNATLAQVLADPGVRNVEYNARGRHIGTESSNSSSTFTDEGSDADTTNTTVKRHTSSSPYIQGLPLTPPAPWHLSLLADWTGKQTHPQTNRAIYPLDGQALGGPSRIYVIDTGIDRRIFEGNVQQMWDFTGSGATDRNGHGTAVAALATGFKYGAAKTASLYSLKACVGSSDEQATCDTNAVIQALQTMYSSELFMARSRPFDRRAIVVMSFHIGLSEAVGQLITAGSGNVMFIAAAGNKGENAEDFFPCGYDGVFCIGATLESLDMWYKSGRGSKVYFVAPGGGVEVPTLDGKSGLRGGTSLAAPQVAGIAAIIRGWEPYLSPCNTAQRMAQLAAIGESKNWKGGFLPKAFVQNGYFGSPAGLPYQKRYLDSNWRCPIVPRS